MAPTYIIINKNEMNSKLKFIKIIKEKKNINTNQKTEWIGFNEFMHIKHPKIIKIEKIKKNSFMIKLYITGKSSLSPTMLRLTLS